MHVSQDRLVHDLTELGKIGATEGHGRTRLVLTPEDFEARRFLITRMRQAGLEVRVDQVGNIIGRRSGSDTKSPIIAFGSHIDTVPNAGRLDGCYGVMSALEVVRTLNDNNVATRHPLEVISFSNEEGVRYPMMIGSKVASGAMELSAAYELKDGSGIPYRQALESGDLTESPVAPARRLVGEIKSWVELHIEQGPVLESEGVKIGVVEGIVGLIHKLVTIRGRTGHAGTTPMIARHDPLLGCAEIIQQVNRIAKETGSSSVGTVGLLRVEPGAMNVIPSKVEMGIDFRDMVAENIDRGMGRIETEIQRVCGEMGLEYTLSERSRLVPQLMSRKIMNSITRAATASGVAHKVMPSGAGHDTQNMARICEAGMIFVPSRDGISHAPDEWTDPSDLALGADVLLGTILNLDRE